MKVTTLAQSLGQRHLENPNVIYPLSDGLGKTVGDGKHFDLRALENQQLTIRMPNAIAAQGPLSSIAHLSNDPADKFYFAFQSPLARGQNANSTELTPPDSSKVFSGFTLTGTAPNVDTTLVRPGSTQTTPTQSSTPKKLINDRAHPDNELFRQALQGVNLLDAANHRTSDAHSEQLAAALAASAKRNDLKQIDHVELSKDGNHAFAIQGDPKAIDRRQASVNTLEALNTPIEKSNGTLLPQKAQVTPPRDDQRHPDHPGHAELQNIRQQVIDLHAKHQFPLSSEQLERTSAAIARDAQSHNLVSVKELRFSEDSTTGKIERNGHIWAFNGDPNSPTTAHAATHVLHAQSTPVEQTLQQMAKITQPQQPPTQQPQQPRQPQQGQVQQGGQQPGGR